jgi:hypothetical protein
MGKLAFEVIMDCKNVSISSSLTLSSNISSFYVDFLNYVLDTE